MSVIGCHFDRVGGNGLLMSRRVTGAVVGHNRFGFPGESAVLSLGVSSIWVGLSAR